MRASLPMPCGCAKNPWREEVVMMRFGGMAGEYVGVGGYSEFSSSALIILGIAALIKYLRS